MVFVPACTGVVDNKCCRKWDGQSDTCMCLGRGRGGGLLGRFSRGVELACQYTLNSRSPLIWMSNQGDPCACL